MNEKGDLISRQAVKDIILGGVSTDTDADKEYVCGLIDNLPSVENKGEWIFDDECHEHGHCSKCGYGKVDLVDGKIHNFCPNCGADMRGE